MGLCVPAMPTTTTPTQGQTPPLSHVWTNVDLLRSPFLHPSCLPTFCQVVPPTLTAYLYPLVITFLFPSFQPCAPYLPLLLPYACLLHYPAVVASPVSHPSLLSVLQFPPTTGPALPAIPTPAFACYSPPVLLCSALPCCHFRCLCISCLWDSFPCPSPTYPPTSMPRTR